MQTEFEFELPRGYLDEHGELQRAGAMRLATAMDEIAPLSDPQVKSNAAYLVIVLLSRVVRRLGSIEEVTPRVIEGLFAADLAYLQAFYQQINETGHSRIVRACPHCGKAIEVDLAALAGE